LQDSIEFLLNSSVPSRKLCLSLDSDPASPSLDQLPEHLLVKILSHLDFRDLLKLSLVSRKMYVVTSQNALWMRFLQRFYPTWPTLIVNPPAYSVLGSAKKQFLRMYWECAL